MSNFSGLKMQLQEKSKSRRVPRETKNDLIRSMNPTWKDLYEEIENIMTK